MKLIVLLPAGELPLGSIVTKKTGKAEFKLSDELRIFDDRETRADNEAIRRTIKATEGTRFMVSTDHPGDVSAINADTVVAWHVDEEELSRWLHDRQMEREDK